MHKSILHKCLPKAFAILSACVLSLSSFMASSQSVALKTNLVNDALLSPNLGIEFGLAPKWTMDIGAEGNYWTIDGHKWKHWFIRPEARYWLCERFSGHFFGVHLIGGQYNMGNLNLHLNFLGSDFRRLKDRRYQGWGAGAGIAYGYAWPVARHWNVEAELGLGWIYTRYDSYPCADCGTKLQSNKAHNYFGPTKAAINLVYLF